MEKRENNMGKEDQNFRKKNLIFREVIQKLFKSK